MQNVFQKGFVSHGLIVLFVEIKQSSRREGSDHLSCWPCNAMSISCLTTIELLKPRYPRIYRFILLPLVASIHFLPTSFFLPHGIGSFAEIGLEPSSYQPHHLAHLFHTAPVYATLPKLVLGSPRDMQGYVGGRIL